MKTFKQVLITLFLAFISLVMISCPHQPESTPTQESEAEQQEANGGSLAETLWFFEDMKALSNSSSSSGNGNSGSGNGSGSGSGSGGGNSSSSGSGSGDGSDSGSSQIVEDTTKKYVHFINDKECVFGTVEISGATRTWTPKFSGTYSSFDGSVSFNFKYKAYLDEALSSTLYAWSNTGWSYNGYSPSDHGLKSQTISYGIAGTKLSFTDTYYKYIWNKQSYTDAEIDGLKIDESVMDELDNKTYVVDYEGESRFMTLLRGKVYTGALYKNTYKNFAGTYALKNYDQPEKTVYSTMGNASVEKQDTNRYWVYCGGYIILFAKSLEEGIGTKVSAIEYNATSKTFGTYKTGVTIYANKNERTLKYMDKNVEYPVDIIPDATAYPSIKTTKYDSSNDWIANEDWCYQNATFYEKSDFEVANPSVKLEYSSYGSYTFTPFGIDSDRILPERLFSGNNVVTVTVLDNTKGVIKLTKGNDEYILEYAKRATFDAPIAGNSDLKITRLYIEKEDLPENLDTDSFGLINEDEEHPSITLYVKGLTSINKSVITAELNAKDAEISMPNQVTDGSTLTVTLDSYSRNYTLNIVNTMKTITLDANNVDYEGTIPAVTYSPYLGLRELTEPECGGYIFTGWNTQANGLGDDVEAPFSKNEYTNDMTLYAQWDFESETVSATISYWWFTYEEEVSNTSTSNIGKFVLNYSSKTVTKENHQSGLTERDILSEEEAEYFRLLVNDDILKGENKEDVICGIYDALKDTSDSVPQPSAIPSHLKADNSTRYSAVIVPKKITFTLVPFNSETYDISGINPVSIMRVSRDGSLLVLAQTDDWTFVTKEVDNGGCEITTYVNAKKDLSCDATRSVFDISKEGFLREFELKPLNLSYYKDTKSQKSLSECSWSPSVDDYLDNNTFKYLPSLDGKTFTISLPVTQ